MSKIEKIERDAEAGRLDDPSDQGASRPQSRQDHAHLTHHAAPRLLGGTPVSATG